MVYAGPARSSRLAIREATRLGTRSIADSGRWAPNRDWKAARTASNCGCARSGRSSRSVVTSWFAVRTRWSNRARPGVR